MPDRTPRGKFYQGSRLEPLVERVNEAAQGLSDPGRRHELLPLRWNPDAGGENYYGQNEMDAFVLSAARNRTQVATLHRGDRAHQLGPEHAFRRAVGEVPDAYELRLCIEHMTFPRRDQIDRAG